MKLLFQKKLCSAYNLVKYCIKYYSQYFALFSVAFVVLVGFSIFRTWAGDTPSYIFTISLWELVRFAKYPVLIFCILAFYQIVILIMNFYQREEGLLRYLPVRKLDILFTELITVTLAALCLVLVPLLLIFLPLHMTAAFWGQLFLALAVLWCTQILLPVFSYQYVVIKTGKSLIFQPYLILFQVVMVVQHALYVMEWWTKIYYGLLVLEGILLLLTIVGTVKKPNHILFHEIRRSFERKKRDRTWYNGMSQGRLIWIEIQRNIGILLQFILFPCALLIFCGIWDVLGVERYAYYYMGFIPCFFVGLFVSYREIYQRMPIKTGWVLLIRFTVGILIMLAVEIPLYALLGMNLTVQKVVNGILFAAVMYLFIYVSGLKLILDGQEKPSYYIILVALQYAYTTLLLYVQEFSYMGFGVGLPEYMVSLLFLIAMGIVLLLQRGRRMS